MSIESKSPSRSTRAPGMPCTTSSLTEAQIEAGKAVISFERRNAAGSRMPCSASRSSSPVVMPGRAAFIRSVRTVEVIFPLRRMISISRARFERDHAAFARVFRRERGAICVGDVVDRLASASMSTSLPALAVIGDQRPRLRVVDVEPLARRSRRGRLRAGRAAAVFVVDARRLSADWCSALYMRPLRGFVQRAGEPLDAARRGRASKSTTAVQRPAAGSRAARRAPRACATVRGNPSRMNPSESRSSSSVDHLDDQIVGHEFARAACIPAACRPSSRALARDARAAYRRSRSARRRSAPRESAPACPCPPRAAQKDEPHRLRRHYRLMNPR